MDKNKLDREFNSGLNSDKKTTAVSRGSFSIQKFINSLGKNSTNRTPSNYDETVDVQPNITQPISDYARESDYEQVNNSEQIVDSYESQEQSDNQFDEALDQEAENFIEDENQDDGLTEFDDEVDDEQLVSDEFEDETLSANSTSQDNNELTLAERFAGKIWTARRKKTIANDDADVARPEQAESDYSQPENTSFEGDSGDYGASENSENLNSERSDINAQTDITNADIQSFDSENEDFRTEDEFDFEKDKKEFNAKGFGDNNLSESETNNEDINQFEAVGTLERNNDSFEEQITERNDNLGENEPDNESESENVATNKPRRSIAKIDYFKYRFLSNSAVGADGKAKVEKLATKYGHRRDENAGIIATENDKDVTIHYDGQFKNNEIDLDFSKRGNAPIYKNSKWLSVACCVFAFIYAVLGMVFYSVFGTLGIVPITVKSVYANFSSGVVFYQEVGSKLTLDGLKFTTNYSDGTQKITIFSPDLISKRPENINEDLEVTSANTGNQPSIIELSLDGSTIPIKVWGYDVTEADINNVTVYYTILNSANIEESNFSNVICWYEYSKIEYIDKEINFTKIINLNASNCSYSGTTISQVTIEPFGVISGETKIIKVEL